MAALCVLSATAFCSTSPAPEFKNKTLEKTDQGYVTLRWEVPVTDPPHLYELQSSPFAAFKDPLIRYQGPDTSSFVSGLNNGDTYFRVRALDAEKRALSPWSKPVTVQVDYPSAKKVVYLLILGGVVFVATVGSILVGHFNIQKENAAE